MFNPLVRLDKAGFTITKRIVNLAYDWFDLNRTDCYRITTVLCLVTTLGRTFLDTYQETGAWYILDWGSEGILSISLAFSFIFSSFFGALVAPDNLGMKIFRLTVLYFGLFNICGLYSHWNQGITKILVYEFGICEKILFLLLAYLSCSNDDNDGPPGGKRKQALDWLKNLGKPHPAWNKA